MLTADCNALGTATERRLVRAVAAAMTTTELISWSDGGDAMRRAACPWGEQCIACWKDVDCPHIDDDLSWRMPDVDFILSTRTDVPDGYIPAITY